MKDFFKRLYNRIFRKKLLTSSSKEEILNTVSTNQKKEDFSYEIKKATNPEICDGNGYGIQKIKDIKELI